MRKISVITGDIVDSTQMGDTNRILLFNKLCGFIETLNVKNDKCSIKYEFYRGDSFQLSMDKIEHTLFIILLLRLFVRSLTPDYVKKKCIWDVRISAGIELPSFEFDTVGLSNGKAYELSGRILDTLKDRKISIATGIPDIDAELKVECLFADNLINGYTQIQSKTVYDYFMYCYEKCEYSQTKFSSSISMNPKTINKRLNGAKYYLLEEFKERFLQIINKL